MQNAQMATSTPTESFQVHEISYHVPTSNKSAVGSSWLAPPTVKSHWFKISLYVIVCCTSDVITQRFTFRRLRITCYWKRVTSPGYRAVLDTRIIRTVS